MELNHNGVPESPFSRAALGGRSPLAGLEMSELIPPSLLHPEFSWPASGATLRASSSGLVADNYAAGLVDPQARSVIVRRFSPGVEGRRRQAADYVLSPDLSLAFRLLPGPSQPVSPSWWHRLLGRRPQTHGLEPRDPGNGTRPLWLEGSVETAVWSPDGGQLALTLRQGRSRLWRWALGPGSPTWRGLLVDAQTGRVRRLGGAHLGQSRLRWSPASDMLAMVGAPPAHQDGWHHLSVWQTGKLSEAPQMLLSARWQVPVEVTFSGDGRFLMLHVHDDTLPVQRNTIDMQALPPPSTGTRVPPAEAAEWSSADSVIFARDGSFVRMGTVGRWSPASSGSEPPFLLSTSWNFVRGMQVSQAGGRAAVLTQGATVGGGHEAELQALLTTFEERPEGDDDNEGDTPPLRLGVQVWLHSPYVANNAYTMLMSWAPRGAYQDTLAVALPNSRSLWLIDSADRGATFELAHDLGLHRWMGWSMCGGYLLVSDRATVEGRSPAAPAPMAPVPVAQLRIYRVGWPQPVLHEYRGLSPHLEGQESPAFAEANLARVTWLLPESIETIDFIEPT